MSGAAAGVTATLVAVARAVAKTVFWGRDEGELLTASGVFLLVFMVVHAVGNAVIFAGADAFNTYGHTLDSNPCVWLLEWYLLAAFALHGSVAVYRVASSGRWRAVVRNPAALGVPVVVMSVSGAVLAAFLWVHLADFRFYNDPHGEYVVDVVDPVTAERVPAKNLHRLALHAFSSAPQCVLYACATLAVGAHMVHGWRRAVQRPSFGLPPAARPAALALGYALVAFICGVFTAVPLAAYAQVV
eukprot:TRINITY_DN4798_c0_g1_i1.p2 TRINITY_DN4798_c0_g1~~TRINITY_DN4798_c0_g1_i1.p2  ORF type:complete len:244 (+),score=69.02 TRINITY_DN4798_c0_g1_i1:61-792(+)